MWSDAIFLPVLSMIIAALATILPIPNKAQCPKGWHNNGVRRFEDVGAFECEAPLPACCGEPVKYGGCSTACPSVQRFHSRIYCTGGSRPIVVNERTVGCSR